MAGEDKKTNALCTHVCNSSSNSSSRSSCNKRHTHVAPSSVAPPAPSGSPHPHSCHIEFSNIWLATFFFAIFLATSINGSHGLAILFFPPFFFPASFSFLLLWRALHLFALLFFFHWLFFLYAALTPKNILSPKKTKTKQSFHQRSSSSSSRKLHAQHDYP